MKISHNKKRNTLFLYEALVREYTRAKLEKNERKLQEIKSLLFEYFSDGKILKEELKIYKAILNTENVDKELAEKILEESKRMYAGLGMDQIFQQQSSLIAKANRKLTPKFCSKSLSVVTEIHELSYDLAFPFIELLFNIRLALGNVV